MIVWNPGAETVCQDTRGARECKQDVRDISHGALLYGLRACEMKRLATFSGEPR